MSHDERPASSLRGRTTRRGGVPSNSDPAADQGNAAEDHNDDEEASSWKVEMESIMGGTLFLVAPFRSVAPRAMHPKFQLPMLMTLQSQARTQR
jgi:hypothetical protein